MASSSEHNTTLKKTLQNAIEVIQETISTLRQEHTSTIETLINDSFNMLPIDDAHSEMMTRVTNQIQTIFKNSLPNMPNNYHEYIFNLLSKYHYDCKKFEFAENLTVNILGAFLNDLEGTRDSIDAFQAAWDGNIGIVKMFLNKYPYFKDKPGINLTTLLYSAARKNHFELVVYLLTDANCSVNAQNEQHFEGASGAETIPASDYKVDPIYGSTALHAACFHGHLKIVTYLIEHGANCYIRNQAEETPISNIRHTYICEYFEKILISSYANENAALPEKPIIEGGQPLTEDCVWEYKSFSLNDWTPCDSSLTEELKDSLRIKADKQFKSEIFLKMSSVLYTISMIQFLRHGGKHKEKEDLAWIRCRGSSILNFDCYSLWQIFLTKHPQGNLKSIPCLNVFDLPTKDDPSFEIQVNTWYNCNAQTNSLFDEMISQRRRSIKLVLDHISDNELEIDMKTFAVKNQQETIEGFIRWIPKFIVKSEDNKNQLKHIDNFQILADVELTLLTTEHLKMLSVTNHTSVDQDEMYVNNEYEGDDDSADPIDSENSLNNDRSVNIQHSSLGSISDSNEILQSILNEFTNRTDVNPNDYFQDPPVTQQISQVEIQSSSIEPYIQNQIENERNKIEELDLARTDQEQLHEIILMSAESEIDAQRIKKELNQQYEQEKQEYQQKLTHAQENIKKLENELKKQQEQRDDLNRMKESIKTRRYINIDKSFMQNFLVPEFRELINYVKRNVDVDEYFHDRIPQITFEETESSYIFTVIGFENHHQVFQYALKRLLNLSKLKQSAQEYYQRCLNRTKRALVTILWDVQSKTNVWKHYVHLLLEAQIQSGHWEWIAKSLLAGYADNVFVSMKDLYEKTHLFVRYNDEKDRAILDLQSTLIRSISDTPVSVVLARDIRYASAVRLSAILSFVGELKPSWIGLDIDRSIESKLLHTIDKLRNKPVVSLQGMTGTVINDEFHLRKQMVTTMQFQLKNNCTPNTSAHENLAKNLESITKMIYIFNPMKWRWNIQKQVKITINDNPANKTCDITVEGRHSENQNVRQEFDSFLSWLQQSAVIRHPNEGVLPRLLHPAVRKRYSNIEKRIASIADSERTMVSRYNGVKGTSATRETRMEVVAWIAVCIFHCKLEGGFVRDWVIGGPEHKSCPSHLINNPKSWIQYRSNSSGQQIPYMHEEIVPADLDCHLSVYHHFDIDKFLDELYKFNILCRVFRENWRYVLLIDENEPTGPFTMDLIEPHVALTHDRIDFDVSNLSLEKDFPREIGMRIDITQSPYLIELETVVDNIINKRFRILRPIDQYVTQRIAKMTLRRWTQHGEPIDYIPRPHFKRYAMLVPLPPKSTLFIELSQIMKQIGNIQIVSIDEIKNPLLEDTYEGMKKLIAKQCKSQGYNPNEQKLFHGTSGDAIQGITEDGFDDRFFSPNGAWGHGAYFADHPAKSHNYTKPGSNQQRVMFYNKVILGVISTMHTAKNTLTSAPPGCHSVKGTAFTYTEYIVYRYAQALPYLKITYK